MAATRHQRRIDLYWSNTVLAAGVAFVSLGKTDLGEISKQAFASWFAQQTDALDAASFLCRAPVHLDPSSEYWRSFSLVAIVEAVDWSVWGWAIDWSFVLVRIGSWFCWRVYSGYSTHLHSASAKTALSSHFFSKSSPVLSMQVSRSASWKWTQVVGMPVHPPQSGSQRSAKDAA